MKIVISGVTTPDEIPGLDTIADDNELEHI